MQALLFCSYNNGVGDALLAAVHSQAPELSPASLLGLELHNIPEDSELSMTLFISTFLMEIWDKRFNKSRIRLYDIRATLEARCLLLRETRYRSQLSTIDEMLNHI